MSQYTGHSTGVLIVREGTLSLFSLASRCATRRKLFEFPNLVCATTLVTHPSRLQFKNALLGAPTPAKINAFHYASAITLF